MPVVATASRCLRESLSNREQPVVLGASSLEHVSCCHADSLPPCRCHRRCRALHLPVQTSDDNCIFSIRSVLMLSCNGRRIPSPWLARDDYGWPCLCTVCPFDRTEYPADSSLIYMYIYSSSFIVSLYTLIALFLPPASLVSRTLHWIALPSGPCFPCTLYRRCCSLKILVFVSYWLVHALCIIAPFTVPAFSLKFRRQP